VAHKCGHKQALLLRPLLQPTRLPVATVWVCCIRFPQTVHDRDVK
jgi:hypothetical protein